VRALLKADAQRKPFFKSSNPLGSGKSGESCFTLFFLLLFPPPPPYVWTGLLLKKESQRVKDVFIPQRPTSISYTVESDAEGGNIPRESLVFRHTSSPKSFPLMAFPVFCPNYSAHINSSKACWWFSFHSSCRIKRWEVPHC